MNMEAPGDGGEGAPSLERTLTDISVVLAEAGKDACRHFNTFVDLQPSGAMRGRLSTIAQGIAADVKAGKEGAVPLEASTKQRPKANPSTPISYSLEDQHRLVPGAIRLLMRDLERKKDGGRLKEITDEFETMWINKAFDRLRTPDKKK